MRNKILQQAGVLSQQDFVLSESIPLYTIPGGDRAVEIWHALVPQAKSLGGWPVILGDPENLPRIQEMIQNNDPAKWLSMVPAGDPLQAIREGELQDFERRAAWFKANQNTIPEVLRSVFTQPPPNREEAPAPPFDDWPIEASPRRVESVRSMTSPDAGPLAETRLAIVDNSAATDIAAYICFGGFNSCPPPHVHVAVARAWHQRYGAVPICLSNDVLEFYVPHPPMTPLEAWKLAGEQITYCSEGGTQIEEAKRIWKSPYWFFWWD